MIAEESLGIFLTFCTDGTGVELNYNGTETIFE